MTQYVAKGMAPVSGGRKAGFSKTHEDTGQKYFPKKALPALYVEMANKLTNWTHFSASTYLWPSRTCKQFFSVTVHYIQKFELKSACLQTSFFPEGHTRNVIAQVYKRHSSNWTCCRLVWSESPHLKGVTSSRLWATKRERQQCLASSCTSQLVSICLPVFVLFYTRDVTTAC